jgi:hypothetical protein
MLSVNYRMLHTWLSVLCFVQAFPCQANGQDLDSFPGVTRQELIYTAARPARRDELRRETKESIVKLHLYGSKMPNKAFVISYATELMFNDIAAVFPDIFELLVDEAAIVHDQKELLFVVDSLRRNLEITRCSNITPKSLERLAALSSKQSASVNAVSFSELAKEFSSRCEWHKANPKVEQPWEKYYRWRYEE